MCCTHTGIRWHRPLQKDRSFINVGVIGRPENDGNTHVWFTLLELENDRVNCQFLPLSYDHERLAGEMRAEGLPEEFTTTLETGWWTTCMEIMPGKERARGKF